MNDLGDDLARLVPDSIVVRSIDGRIRRWNAGAERLYGWPAHLAVGETFDDLLRSRHPFGIAAIQGSIEAAGAWEGEIYRTASDGREMRVAIRATLRRDGDGTPAEIVEWARDTEHASQSELDAHRYRNVFHAMAASFWELDFSRVRKAIGDIVASGEADIVGFLRTRPDFIDAAIEMVSVVDVNEQTVALFGASRDAILSRHMGWAWPPESRHVFAESLVAAAKREDSYSTETVITAFDGRRIDVLFTVCWPSAHKAKGTVLVGVIDISERKRASADLRHSEQKYRRLFEAMAVGYLEADMDRTDDLLDELRAIGVTDAAAYIDEHPEFVRRGIDSILLADANEKAVELFQANSRGEMLGSCSRFIPPESEWAFRLAFISRYHKRPFDPVELRLRTAKGELIDIRFTTWTTPDRPRGERVLISLLDIGEHKRAYRQLVESEHRYRDLFQHMPIALWQSDTSALVEAMGALKKAGVTDLSAYIDAHPEFLVRCLDLVTVQEVNAATMRIWGAKSLDDFRGATAADLWRRNPGPFRRSLEARWAGKPGHAEETRMLALDGREIDVAFSVAYPPALQEYGITVSATVDIHDRKRAEERLRQALSDFSHAARVSTLGELTASIAHEVNQPLTAIAALGQASLRWLARPEPDLNEIASLAEGMVEDALRASSIIDRIRGMALKRDPEYAPIDINDVVEEALLIVRHESELKSVDLSIRLGEGLPRILGDRVQLQQVVINLAVNAIQAMASNNGKPRRLTVSTGRGEAGEVLASVSDTGSGIAACDMENLFTGFFTTKKDGMGMGLSICRSIVQAHGGTINVANHHDGAIFTVGLPAAQAAPPQTIRSDQRIS